jgi:Tol biopolymer transport system component
MVTLGTPELYNGVELAPDGRHAAVERISPRDGTSNIWLVDPDTGLETQFTFDGASHPIWSPDGRFVTFNRNRAVFRKPVDGTAAEEQVYRESDGGVFGPVADWLPDGRAFVMRDVPEGTGSATGRLVLVTPGSATKPAAIAGTQFNGRVSPDGKWLAYSADENGVEEVYVQPFPATGAKWLVSRGGGVRPRWRRDGRELFFIASSAVNGAGHLMAVPVDAQPQFRVGTPRPLLDAPFVPGSANEYTYSVSPDGQRILVIEPTADAKRAPFTFVINWTAALQRR